MFKVEEQETIINYSRAEKCATVWTSDKTTMTKLNKMCEKYPEIYSISAVDYLQDGTLASITYTITDKRKISFRGVSRKLSAEQRAVLSERLKKIREKL